MVTTTEYYKQNPEKYTARRKQIKERERELRRRVQEYRVGKTCVRCGFADHRAIDFHHRDPLQKEVKIAELYRKGWSWERMRLELDKCDPLCRNCHAILHAEERENAPLAQ